MYSTDIPEWKISRTFEEHLQNMGKTLKKGCVRQPLLQVDSTCCPPDILHMKKGIISKLVNQLVNWAIVQNREDKLIDEMTRNKIHFR